MKPSDDQKQTQPGPSVSSPTDQHMFESPASLRQDQFISTSNEKVYAFHHNQRHLSLKQRFGLLSRAEKILWTVGLLSAVFVISVIALSFAMYQPAKKSGPSMATAKKTVTSVKDLNGDGKVDSTDTKIAIGDVNGDGVVDNADIAFAEADANGDGQIDSSDTPVSEEDISWWQSLLSKVQMSGSNDDTTSADSSDDGAWSYDSKTTSAEEDDSTTASLTDEEILAYSEDTSGAATEDEINDPAITQPSISYSGADTNLTIASWNMLRVHNVASNGKAGIQAIFQKAQVIGLQEVGMDSQKKMLKDLASSSIGVYSPGPNTPIVWNNTLYQKVASGYKGIIKSGIVKYAIYVKLRNRSTGQQFYVFNFHATVGVSSKASQGCSTTICNVYKYEMTTLSNYIKAHKSDNVPIFVTGDYNVDYRSDNACKITWFPCATFGKLGMKSGFDYTKLAGIGSTASTISSGDRLIDYIFSWQRNDVEPISVSIIGPNAVCHRDSSGQNHCWNGSDHKPSLFTVKLR